jgi:mono/diheme cytochrome c family protein
MLNFFMKYEKSFKKVSSGKDKVFFSINLAITFLLILALYSCKEEKENRQLNNYGKVKSEESVKSPLQKSITSGKKIYTAKCAQCHLPNGNGIPNMYPPLRKSNWLTDKRKESIHAVKYGLQGPIKVNGKTYDNVMLPLNLEDQEIADALNYVMNTWGNTQEKSVTKQEVSEVQK